MDEILQLAAGVVRTNRTMNDGRTFVTTIRRARSAQ